MHGIKITELFSYALRAQLAWYMQNFIQINLISFGWEQNEFSIKLELHCQSWLFVFLLLLIKY